MEEEQNDIVSINPIQQGKYENTYLKTLTCRFMINICTNIYIYSTYILTKYRARTSLVATSFLFNTQNKSFHDRVISLVHKRKVLQSALYFYLPKQPIVILINQ